MILVRKEVSSVKLLIVLYAALWLTNALGSFAQKKYSDFVSGIADACLYSMITGIVACLFFWCSNGFKLYFNLRTVIYAAVFAVLVLLIHVLNLFALQMAGITKKMVIGSAISLPTTWLIGLLLFQEAFHWNSLLSCLSMLAAGILLAFSHPMEKGQEHRRSRMAILLSVLAGMMAPAATVLSKFFAIDTAAGTVTDSNSYFFLTNVFVVAFCFIMLPIVYRGNFAHFKGYFRQMSPKRIGLILLSTVSSNAGSLLGIRILLIGTVSLYGPLSSALSMLAGFAVGLLFFHERPKWLPLILASVSVALGFFS